MARPTPRRRLVRAAQAEIVTLESLHAAALEDRVEADLLAGRHGELVPELEALVARHPFRERLRGQLMLALYRVGRQSDALAAYREAVRTLDAGFELSGSRRIPLRSE